MTERTDTLPSVAQTRGVERDHTRMSQNDAIVLRANFEAWKGKEGRGDGLTDCSPWLYYCLEQFVKPYMLDDGEIKSGITDGSNDGGADAIYFLVNQRQLVTDITQFKSGSVSKVRVLFIQVKEHGGFQPTEVEKFLELTGDFFDLSKPADSFGERYNSRVIAAMRTWKENWVKIASDFPDSAEIDYYYITGDDVRLNSYANDAGTRVTDRAKSQVSKANSTFFYVGAAELWEQVQKRPPKTKTLKWSEAPMNADDGSVGLVKLTDYLDFIEDEPGVLAERYFESNIRGYQDDVAVNKEIAASLSRVQSNVNFWLLNNGITIISSKVNQVGGKSINIQDPQIVNGLQTSREIFNHFRTALRINDNRSVLVRVIETDDVGLQAQVIKATNSQNKMMPSQLRMTDKIHRDIEEHFKHEGLFYDRRKGFYKDQGRPVRLIISSGEVAQAIMSIILQRPDDARARPGDYFKDSKDDARYNSVFGDGVYPLKVYLISVKLVLSVEAFLRKQQDGKGAIKNLKFYVAAMVAQEMAGMGNPPPSKIVSLGDISSPPDAMLEAVYKRVRKAYDLLAKDTDGDIVARGKGLLTRLKASASRRFKVKAK